MARRPTLVLLASSLVVACGGDSTTAPPPPAGPVVTTVVVAPGVAELAVPDTVRLTATVKDQNGNVLTGRSLAWSSGSTGVATVAADGLVTAVAQGQATITATVDGKSGTAAITVLASVGRVVIDQDTTFLDVGNGAQRAALVTDGGGNPLTSRVVTWSSATPAIATVSATGLVTAVKPGLTQLIAVSEGKADTAAVVVKVPPFVPVAASSGGVTRRVGTAGDTLRATGPDGTKYTFVVPRLSLKDTVAITMTPLASATGGPLSGGMVGGVDFRPSGLSFASPATLRIETTKVPPAGQRLVGVRYEGTGTDLSLAPARDSAGVVTMLIPHFSGAVVGFGTLDDVEAMYRAPARPRSTLAAFYLTELAWASAQSPRDRAFELQILEDWFDDIVLPAMRTTTTDAQLVDAIGDYAGLRAMAELFDVWEGHDPPPSFQRRVEDWRAMLRGPLQRAIEGNMALCAAPGPTASRIQSLDNGLFWYLVAAVYFERGASGLDPAWFDSVSCAGIDAIGQERLPEPLEYRPNDLEMTFRLVFKSDGVTVPTDFEIFDLTVSGATHSLPTRTAATPVGRFSGPITPDGTGEAVTLFLRACYAFSRGLPSMDLCRDFLLSRTAKGLFKVRFDAQANGQNRTQTTGHFVDWTVERSTVVGHAKAQLASALSRTDITLATRGIAHASAGVSFEDRIVIDAPGLTGSLGVVRVQAELPKSIVLSPCTDPLQTYGASSIVELLVGGHGGRAAYLELRWRAHSCGGADSELPAVAQSGDILFRYGEAFPLTVDLSAFGQGTEGHGVTNPTASVSLGLRWLGMTGLPAGATVRSGSRIDWSKAASP